MTVFEQCVPADGEWTITWFVKNESGKKVDIEPTAGGVTPADGYTEVPNGQTRTFTKTVNAAGNVATFEASWAENDQTDTASATSELTGKCVPPVATLLGARNGWTVDLNGYRTWLTCHRRRHRTTKSSLGHGHAHEAVSENVHRV